MHAGALLELATDLLHRVLSFEAPADSVVSNFLRRHRALGARARQLLADTMFAVLRQRLLLEHLARSGTGSIERRLVLLGWQGEASTLHSALEPNERLWLEHARAVDATELADAHRHNLPDWLAQALRAEVGVEFWPLAHALNQPAGVDLRVNVLKAKREDVLVGLKQANIDAVPTPYSPIGLRLTAKRALHKLDVFLRGDIEVQDEGSQLLALLAGAKRGEMVADFCAGAGGKTLALGAAMRNTGRLYAFDVSGHRLAAIKPRLARAGLTNVYTVQIAHERDPRIEAMVGKMDRVLVDAPCSGLGTLRRSPDLKWRQSPASLREMTAKQRAILSSAVRLLKPGGRLVCATCSLLEAEGEAIALDFAAAHASDLVALPVAELLARVQVPAAESLVRGNFLRLWPHRHGTDGFFAAAWERS